MKTFVLQLSIASLLVGCSATTAPAPSTSLTCEQRFDRALNNGVPYTEALGDYTQCLLDRGDTVRRSVPSRLRDY